jgi:protein TonB
MRTRSDLAVAFLAAAAIHGVAGVCANSLLANGGGAASPLFQPGVSGLSLTLAPLRENLGGETRAPPEAARKDPATDRVARPAEPAVEASSGEPVLRGTDENLLAGLTPGVRRETAASDTAPVGEIAAGSARSDNDGDLLAKGVESSWAGLSEIRPRYPLGARVRGEEGVVRVTAEITAAGRAQNARVAASSGHAALDRAAVDAVTRARFAARGTSPVPGQVTLSFRFQLVE